MEHEGGERFFNEISRFSLVHVEGRPFLSYGYCPITNGGRVKCRDIKEVLCKYTNFWVKQQSFNKTILQKMLLLNDAVKM